jgi:alpha-1,2-mannosyltransferase
VKAQKIKAASAERPPFVFWACLWLSGPAFALVAGIRDIFFRDAGTPLGRDFSNLWVAGKLVIQGQPWLAFDLNTFRLAMHDHLGVLTLQNYSYPPQALFLAAPFGIFPYGVAFALWSLVSVCVFWRAARPYTPFPAWLGILTPAAALNIWNGHYGLILGALWLVYFANYNRRPIVSGLSAAALTFKPHMGLFILITSLKRRSVFVTAAIGSVAIVLASAAAFGLACWYAFVDTTVLAQTEILMRTSGEFYFKMMPSAYAAYGRGPIGLLVHLAFAGYAIWLLWKNWRIDPFLLATATFIIVPYVFIYDMAVACLGFAILLWRDWGELTVRQRAILTSAFFVPDISLVVPAFSPIILIAALEIQVKLQIGRSGEPASPSGALASAG